MTDNDFRYTMPDGTVLEAIQVTEGSRYDEENWPDWLSSRMFMTTEDDAGNKKHYLTINDVETEIPPYFWLVKGGDNVVRVESWELMEQATKVVRVIPKIPDMVKPMAEDALGLAAKMTKRTLEEVREEDLMQVMQANRRRQEMIDALHPEDAAKMGLEQSPAVPAPTAPPAAVLVDGGEQTGGVEALYDPPELGVPDNVVTLSQSAADRGLLMDCRGIYDLMRMGKQSEINEGIKRLRDVLIDRANWCSCPPGKCEGNVSDTWDCRENSPLAK